MNPGDMLRVRDGFPIIILDGLVSAFRGERWYQVARLRNNCGCV